MPAIASFRPASTAHDAPTHIAQHIDDLLGPARARYFGEAYRKVRHDLRDLAVDEAAEGVDRARAAADICYPVHWSSGREGMGLRPHLSTIDTLVLAVQLCEGHLVHRFGLHTRQRRRMWVRRVEMRAGSRPQEDLVAIPVGAVLKQTSAVAGALCTHVSTLDCTVGTMKVRCEIEHDIIAPCDTAARFDNAEDLLGPAENRYYGAGFRRRGHDLRDVAVDGVEYVTCTARIEASGEEAHWGGPGIEAAYGPAVSMLDGVLILAQLAEVLMFRLDGLERSRANPMWMRRLVLESRTPYRSLADTAPASLSVTGSKTIECSGVRWRIADMAACYQGVEAMYCGAHKLPDPAGNRASGES